MGGGRRPATITRDGAEAIGAQALLFVAEDGARLGRFLTETGLDPGTLAAQARTPEMLAAILGHLLADESSLLAFTANAGLPPEDVARAEAVLAGAKTWDST